MDFQNIPIINYHKVELKSDIGITTRRPQDFINDIHSLTDLGYQTITFLDLHEEKPLPPKPVIITFDDGYESVFTKVLPVMRSAGFKGVVYIPSAFINRYNDWDVQFGNKKFKHLNKAQLLELQGHGFEIGSHTVSHMALTKLSPGEIARELAKSKGELETILGREVISVCYPFGQFNNDIIRIAKECGYRFGLGSVHYNREDENMALRRFNIYRFDSRNIFNKKLVMKKKSFLVLRDRVIQKGGLATVYYQKIIKNKYNHDQ